MWSYNQSARRKRCRDLKYKGYTIKEIMAVTGFTRSTVGRYVEGVKDQREKQAPISQKRPISQSEGKGKKGEPGKYGKNGKSRPGQHISQISKKETASVGNADQDSISYISQCRGKGNVGVTLIVFLGIVFLILILVDHFLLDDKFFTWVLGDSPLISKSENQTEETKEGLGFEDRDINDPAYQ